MQNYDTDKFENYKSEDEKKKAESFHQSRTAFLIIDDKVHFLQNSKMSHLEWAKTLGLTEEEFNNITRGYALGENIVFYKGNFCYDDKVIADAKMYAKDIKTFVNIPIAKVYAGLIVGIGTVWPPREFLFEI